MPEQRDADVVQTSKYAIVPPSVARTVRTELATGCWRSAARTPDVRAMTFPPPNRHQFRRRRRRTLRLATREPRSSPVGVIVSSEANRHKSRIGAVVTVRINRERKAGGDMYVYAGDELSFRGLAITAETSPHEAFPAIRATASNAHRFRAAAALEVRCQTRHCTQGWIPTSPRLGRRARIRRSTSALRDRDQPRQGVVDADDRRCGRGVDPRSRRTCALHLPALAPTRRGPNPPPHIHNVQHRGEPHTFVSMTCVAIAQDQAPVRFGRVPLCVSGHRRCRRGIRLQQVCRSQAAADHQGDERTDGGPRDHTRPVDPPARADAGAEAGGIRGADELVETDCHARGLWPRSRLAGTRACAFATRRCVASRGWCRARRWTGRPRRRGGPRCGRTRRGRRIGTRGVVRELHEDVACFSGAVELSSELPPPRLILRRMPVRMHFARPSSECIADLRDARTPHHTERFSSFVQSHEASRR